MVYVLSCCIELGFKQAGFDIAWANDMDKNAMVTYELCLGVIIT